MHDEVSESGNKDGKSLTWEWRAVGTLSRYVTLPTGKMRMMTEYGEERLAISEKHNKAGSSDEDGASKSRRGGLRGGISEMSMEIEGE